VNVIRGDMLVSLVHDVSVKCWCLGVFFLAIELMVLDIKDGRRIGVD